MNGINQITIQKANDYNPDNIQLVYQGKLSGQFHIEAYIYIYSADDFEKDNNINVVIVKTDQLDYAFDDEFDDDYDEFDDDYVELDDDYD